MPPVYFMPRTKWSAALEQEGCKFDEDVPGLENPAEAWITQDGRTFLVPYRIGMREDADINDDRKLADYLFRRIIKDIGDP